MNEPQINKKNGFSAWLRSPLGFLILSYALSEILAVVDEHLKKDPPQTMPEFLKIVIPQTAHFAEIAVYIAVGALLVHEIAERMLMPWLQESQQTVKTTLADLMTRVASFETQLVAAIREKPFVSMS